MGKIIIKNAIEREKKLKTLKELDYLDTLPLWKYWLKGGNTRYVYLLNQLQIEICLKL